MRKKVKKEVGFFEFFFDFRKQKRKTVRIK